MKKVVLILCLLSCQGIAAQTTGNSSREDSSSNTSSSATTRSTTTATFQRQTAGDSSAPPPGIPATTAPNSSSAAPSSTSPTSSQPATATLNQTAPDDTTGSSTKSSATRTTTTPAPTHNKPNKPTAQPDSSRKTGNNQPSFPTSTYDAPAHQRPGSLLGSSGPQTKKLVSKKKSLPPLRQIVVTAKNQQEAEQQRKSLTELGLKIRGRKNLLTLGMVVSTFNIPPGLDVSEAAAMVQELFPDATTEKNQRYRLLASSRKYYAQTMLGIHQPSQCQQSIPIAMLDSYVDTSVEELAQAEITVYDITRKKRLQKQHATAVASLLVGNSLGVLPRANLTAVNIFALDSEDQAETRTDWILAGLEKAASTTPKPFAINLSFGGAYSRIIELAVSQLSQDILLVAAAGNNGTNELVYPAAYQQVYAIGATTAKGQRLKQSNYGEHIQLWAPGEDIWVSKLNGGGLYVSGTSYASPFASAALALVKSKQGSLRAYIDALGSKKRLDFAGLCL